MLLFVPFPSCFPINFHFFQIADSDFDAFVYSDKLVCRSALFPPYTRFVVPDILFFAAA